MNPEEGNFFGVLFCISVVSCTESAPERFSSMLDWSQCPEVERDPAIVGGALRFRGTRVPVETLFENLKDGVHIGDFIQWFPSVNRRQVEAVLEFAAKSLAVA
jgi:uncharacterized protein (DUF433 family)